MVGFAGKAWCAGRRDCGVNDETRPMSHSRVCANMTVSSEETQGGLNSSETALFFHRYPSHLSVNKPLIAVWTRFQPTCQKDGFSTSGSHFVKQVQIYVFLRRKLLGAYGWSVFSLLFVIVWPVKNCYAIFSLFSLCAFWVSWVVRMWLCRLTIGPAGTFMWHLRGPRI